MAELVGLCGYLPLAISLLASLFNKRRSWTMGHLISETKTTLLTATAENRTVAAAFDLWVVPTRGACLPAALGPDNRRPRSTDDVTVTKGVTAVNSTLPTSDSRRNVRGVEFTGHTHPC
jgi:hypothetical protein